MQRSSLLLWRRIARSSTQNSASTVRGGSVSSQSARNRGSLNPRLNPSAQPESPGRGIGARRQSALGAKSASIRNPASGATAESDPDQLLCRVAPDLRVLPFNQPRTGGGPCPSQP